VNNILQRERNYAVADYYATHVPLVIVKANAKAPASGNTVPMLSDHYASSDHSAAFIDSIGVVDEMTDAKLAVAQYRIEEMNKARSAQGRMNGESTTGAKEDVTDMWDPFKNRIMLPDGTSLERPPPPSSIDDFHKFVNMNLHFIAQWWGVPPSMITLDRASHVANELTVMRLFNKTVMSLQEKIGPVVFDACMSIFGASMERVVKKKLEATEAIIKRPLTIREVGNIKKNQRIDVTFPGTPLFTPDQITLLYDKEVITHKTYAKHMLNVSGLGVSEGMKDSECEKERARRFAMSAVPSSEPAKKKTQSLPLADKALKLADSSLSRP
jgi:hypothetical protein